MKLVANEEYGLRCLVRLGGVSPGHSGLFCGSALAILAETSSAGSVFVPHNESGWYAPLESLRRRLRLRGLYFAAFRLSPDRK